LRLAAIEVCRTGPLTEEVRDLIARVSNEQAARGGSNPTHSELVQRCEALRAGVDGPALTLPSTN
jgi:hypothetical protein